MEFAHVVPLGRRCRTTHNVHSFFGRKESFPYDWYILPLRAVIRSLNEGADARAIYRPERMVPVREDGKIIHVRNKEYGLWHVHCFPHEAGGHFITEDWQDHIDNAVSRFEHTARRLNSLKDQDRPVLFVREGKTNDTERDALDLKAAIKGLIGSTPFHLLLISYPESEVPPGFENVIVEERRGFGWRGDEEAWAKALAGTGHRLSPSDQRG